MTRMISRAAASAALLAAMGTFCAADDYAPAPAPAPKPAPTAPWEPVFTEMQLAGNAGLPSNGLQLKLTADQLVLPENLGPAGKPLIIAPTALHLAFSNASDHPITLDAYNLTLSRLSLVVVGPEKKTVAVLNKPLTVHTRQPLPIDYPRIEPGLWFTTLEPLQFPGDFNLLVNYSLYKPGEYKVQLVYSRPPGRGVWDGAVVSNTLIFRIAGPMPPKLPENATPENPPETAPQPSSTPPAP